MIHLSVGGWGGKSERNAFFSIVWLKIHNHNNDWWKFASAVTLAVVLMAIDEVGSFVPVMLASCQVERWSSICLSRS
eukprot:5900617-Amphidinium_carterae.2